MIYYKADGGIQKSSNPNDLYFGWWLSDLMARSPLDALEFHDQYYDDIKQKQQTIDSTYLILNKNLRHAKQSMDKENIYSKSSENFPVGILKKHTLDYTFKGVNVEKKKSTNVFSSEPEIHEKILSLLRPDFIGYEQLGQLVTANKIHWSRLKMYEKLKHSALKNRRHNSGSNKKTGKQRLHRDSGERIAEGSPISKINTFPKQSFEKDSNFCEYQEEDITANKLKDRNNAIVVYPLVSLESPYFDMINDMVRQINYIRQDVQEATKRVRFVQNSYNQDDVHCQNLLEDVKELSKDLQEKRLLNDIIWLLSGELQNISSRKWPFKINIKSKTEKDKEDANYII